MDGAESETVVEKAELRELEVGQVIRYCSQDRQWYDALVTAIHGEARYQNEKAGDYTPWYPLVNLVFVVNNENQHDQYGRQTAKESSVNHYNGAASGFFWCYPEEDEAAFEYMKKAMRNIKS